MTSRATEINTDQSENQVTLVIDETNRDSAPPTKKLKTEETTTVATPTDSSSPDSTNDVFSDDEESNDDDPNKGRKSNSKKRLVWTPTLHRLFVDTDIIDHEAVPKRILKEMDVEGLTRENVASHLQKYRLQEKRQEMFSQMSRQFPGDYADPMAMVSSPHPNMMTFKLNKNPLTVSTPPQTTWSPKPEAALQKEVPPPQFMPPHKLMATPYLKDLLESNPDSADPLVPTSPRIQALYPFRGTTPPPVAVGGADSARVSQLEMRVRQMEDEISEFKSSIVNLQNENRRLVEQVNALQSKVSSFNNKPPETRSISSFLHSLPNSPPSTTSLTPSDLNNRRKSIGTGEPYPPLLKEVFSGGNNNIMQLINSSSVNSTLTLPNSFLPAHRREKTTILLSSEDDIRKYNYSP